MRRRTAIGDVSEAFELFLDTVTNSFGGVVFISLLVCILLQIRGSPAKDEPEADMARARAIQIDLTSVREEIGRLEELARRVRGEATATTERTDPRMVAEYERLSAEKEAEEAALETMEKEEPLRNQKAADLTTRLTALSTEQERLRKQVDELEKKIEEVHTRTSHRIRLPRYHATVKEQIPLAVFNQRLYFSYQYDGQANRLGRNEVDFTAKPSLDGDTILIPKPNRGAHVEANQAFRTELRRTLEKFDKDTSYVHLAVWPDSYNECEVIRDVLIDLGFGYGLLLLEDGSQLVFSSTGQRGEM